MNHRKLALWLCVFVSLPACATLHPRAGFPELSAAIEERAAMRVQWNRGTELDDAARDELRALLERRLTADDAVQIALLNNRDLQAVYTELGIAQADLVQAGLFKNPLLDAAVFFPLSGVRPDFSLNVVVGFLDVFYVPLRKRVAAAAFEEAKLRVTGAVLEFAGQVRTAFYVHQANEQLLELRQTIVQALGAAFDVSRRLHEAGNISDLDLARDRALTEASRLALRAAEVTARQSREQLNELMGAWGEQTGWQIDTRLPDIPGTPILAEDLERLALARSLDLSTVRQRTVVARQQLGYSRATALVPDAEIGPGAEREGDEAWKVGPVLTIPIPLFDQGQARVGRAVAELRRARQEHYALAVRIRAAARASADRLLGAQDRALYYRDIVLPLQERIVAESQLQYNAMQIGVVQLLRDRERQIESAVEYVETLREYWLARGDVALLASGRLPAANGGRPGGVGGSRKTTATAGH